MKPTTAVSLLALAYATTVIAVPTPNAPEVSAVPVESDSGTLNARDPMMWGPKKVFPGENFWKKDTVQEDEAELDRRMMWGPKKVFPGENFWKREGGKPEGQGYGFDPSNAHTKPEGMPEGGSGHPGPQGPQGGPQGQGQQGPQFGQGQGMGGDHQGQGANGGKPFGGQGGPQ